MTARGLVIAAPASGAGKTTLTLGLLRALSNRGVDIRAAKSGPDYIDPAFHAVATGHPSVNLDAWAMPPDQISARAASQGGDMLIVEGAMGVLDAAANGAGSVADLAATLGLPVVMVLDIAKQGQSTALAVAGLRRLRPDLPLAGVILNRAGSDRHLRLAAAHLDALSAPVLGHLKRDPALTLPERHLGLVQARETDGIEDFLEGLAAVISQSIDLDAVIDAARPLPAADTPRPALTPPGQRIAIASDRAFAFAYPHLLDDWRRAGAELHFFSPLADQTPPSDADAVYLPGGYPELHAGALAAADHFRSGMHDAAARGVRIYGECGGYMTLGRTLTDADGRTHPMLGLLPVDTSFAARRLTLGYRQLTPLAGSPWAGPLYAHEFHYATVTAEEPSGHLFEVRDAEGQTLPPAGHVAGSVSGSFCHVIC